MGFDYGKYFGEIRLTHDLTTRADERTWRLAAPEARPARKPIVLYLGCNVLRTSHMIRTVTAVFDRLGLDYVAVGGPTYCCGIVHHQQGDAAAGDGMAKRTLELFKRYEPDEVVMWCPSCIYFYDEVLHAEVPYRVRHTTEFLLAQVPRMAFTARVERTVAVHAHAVGEARQREARACRELLASVPGLRLVPLASEPRSKTSMASGNASANSRPIPCSSDPWPGKQNAILPMVSISLAAAVRCGSPLDQARAPREPGAHARHEDERSLRQPSLCRCVREGERDRGG